jgi:predicted Holliday junction resolvase-like endonuclease
MKIKNLLIIILTIVIFITGFLIYDKTRKVKDIEQQPETQIKELSQQDIAIIEIEEAIKNNNIPKLEELISQYG